ncbi:nicotinate-nucleotide adenylyltransferase [Vicingaceae bacterium]|nr:nicotinate-nucleotide adenylyltransferase [Vicingaceae bacterium]
MKTGNRWPSQLARFAFFAAIVFALQLYSLREFVGLTADGKYPQMKIGIFGGSFDPVHYGHLIMAEQCREYAALDQVWFVPTAKQPLKPDGPQSGNKQRLEMLKLATAGHSGFRVSSVEIDRGDVSYTIDTLKEIKQQRPHDDLFLVLGADSLAKFNQWKEPDEICNLAIPLVVRRPGTNVSFETMNQFMNNARFEMAAKCQIESPLIEISSTQLRKSISEGRSVRYQLPRAVEKFIETNKLYASNQ